MDGVIVDFNKGYHQLTGQKLDGEHRNDTYFWDPINAAGYDFWYNLEWMADGKQLWDYIKDYDPKLLSAPSNRPDSRVAKHDWVNKHLPDVKLILRNAKHKKDFAASDAILIDDRIDNVEDWIRSGGIGILHTSTKQTIKDLIKLGV